MPLDPRISRSVNTTKPSSTCGKPSRSDSAASKRPFTNTRRQASRSAANGLATAAPAGALADLIASTVNPNVVSWKSSPMATEIEAQVTGWIASLLDYPADAGLMVSGGNAANFVGFFAARRAKTDWDIRRLGVRGAVPPLCLYVSKETHTWVEKAADLGGLGTDAIRWIDTDSKRRMRVDSLQEQIKADRDAGYLPFMVVGTAGTVSTGASNTCRV